MLPKLRARATDESGFTLIELLVVILIIGILAAVAMPSFLNQQEKAKDTAAKSDARTAQTAIETYYTERETYATDSTALTTIESALKNARGLDVAGDNNSYMVQTQSTGSGGIYYAIIRDDIGNVTRVCGTDSHASTATGVTFTQGGGTGGCTGRNTW